MLSRIVLPTLAIVSLAGCEEERDQCGGSARTMGERDRARFAYDRGLLGCLFGCGADEPMALGARAAIQVVNDEELPVFTVTSSDPTIATFVRPDIDPFVVAEAHATGTARLVLRDSNGDTIDQLPIRVRAPAEIAVSQPEAGERLVVMVGGDVHIGVDLIDDAGCALVGVGGVRYELTGGITEEQVTFVDALADFIVSMLIGSVDEYADITATQVGEGNLRITTANGIVHDVPLAIVDESAVASVTLSPQSGRPTVGEAYWIGAIVSAADGARIEGANCEWVLDPPDGPVTPTPSYGGISLSTDVPATVTVTCTVGDASDSLEVGFR